MMSRGNYFLTVALAISTVAVVATGCSSDPNGSTASTGGAGGGNPGGGTGGAGGSAAPTLGAIVGTPVQTFDTASGAFILSNYVPVPPSTEVNLAGTGTATMAMTTVAWDGTEGSPTPGCLKITAPFSDWNQWVEVQAATQAPVLDWTGKKMHVRLKVASGFVADMFALPGAQALVDTTSAYVQVNAAKAIIPGNGWQEFVVDMAAGTMTGFDASKVITYGIHIYSGTGSPTAAKPTPAVIYVDSFSLE